MVDDQLLAKDERCATSGAKIMTRTINKLKMRSETGKVVLLAFKIIKLACRALLISS